MLNQGEGDDVDPWEGHPSPRIELLRGRPTSLDIMYTATSFSDPSKVRFRYKLEGLDKTWQEAGSNQRRAICPYLKPGRYVFHVQACNNQGYWNPRPARGIAFNLPPHFYQTWPFYLACGFLALPSLR